MPTPTQITCTQHDRNGVRCQALFSSALQPSDAPTPGMVATAISRAIQQFGIGGCAARMAQEFGDHPDAEAPCHREHDYVHRDRSADDFGTSQESTVPAHGGIRSAHSCKRLRTFTPVAGITAQPGRYQVSACDEDWCRILSVTGP